MAAAGFPFSLSEESLNKTFLSLSLIYFIKKNWGGGTKGVRPSWGGGGAKGRHRNDFFPHHIYCAQSKVKWGWAHGVNGPWEGGEGGGGMDTHSYATAFT